MWIRTRLNRFLFKVKKTYEDSLDSMPSPSPSNYGPERCKGKTLLGVVNKLFVFNSLLTTPSNVLPLHLKQTFPPLIWIFTEGEGDGIEFRLPFKSSLLLKWCIHYIFWSLDFCDKVTILYVYLFFIKAIFSTALSFRL